MGRFSFVFQVKQYNNYLSYKKSLIDNNLEHQKNLLGQSTNKKSESKYYWKYIFYNRDLREELFYNEKYKTYNLPEGFYTIGNEEKKNYMTLFDSKEKEYKKFLFYKYFYGNSNAIIVTEGKTDPRYIKAALKNLYLQYPELIEKSGNKFIFKIDFLKHSNTIEYLFNVSEGGPGFKAWYNYFSHTGINVDKKIYPNYISFFEKMTSRKPKNPVMFLFDNEFKEGKNKTYPLYDFITNLKELEMSSDNLDIVRKGDQFYRIARKNNLYIMTVPMLLGREKTDMEDLLLFKNKNTIRNFFNIKKIKFNKIEDIKNHKEIFSKYVLKNYSQFDFSEFIPLLDGIRYNILDYKMKK